MHEIELVIVSKWQQLVDDLKRKNPRSLELFDYMADSDPGPLPWDDFVAYRGFLETWGGMQMRCTPEMSDDIDTAIFLKKAPQRAELPLFESLGTGKAGVWDIALFILSPESVREAAKVTENFDLDSHLVHFSPPQRSGYFNDKENFRLYCQVWLAYFNAAASTDSGLVILYL